MLDLFVMFAIISNGEGNKAPLQLKKEKNEKHKGRYLLMRKTRIIALIAALSVAGLMLTACGSSAETEETTTAETTVAEVEDTSAAETEASTESVESELVEDESVEEVTDEGASDEEVVEEGDIADEPVSSNSLQPLADAAMSVGEWPMLMEVTDDMILTDYYQFDLSKYEAALVMQNPMSANMTEIIIFKSADVDAAKADLEVRRTNAIAMHAFYPDDVVRAEASIVGTEGDYAYFIMGDYAADGEKALVEAIKAL